MNKDDVARIATNPALAKQMLRSLRADFWANDLGIKIDARPYESYGREYINALMRDSSDHIVVPKAAQMGFTVALILLALHRVIEKKWHTLYLMPFKQGSINFVQGRIDPIIDSSPFLASCFDRTDNRTHKQTKDYVNLYVRGTNIMTELREIPVDFEIWDERDKMIEENLTEALARMDGSRVRKYIEVSTPTHPGHGVDSDDAWKNSDQHRWYVPCPHCGQKQVLNFQENILPWVGDVPKESEIHCSYCKKNITDNERWDLNPLGSWQPTHLDGEIRGYHISQLNSPTKKFIDIITPYHQGLRDSASMRGFYNNALGEPYVAAGDKITFDMLDDCRSTTNLRSIPQGPIYVGIDIGNKHHVTAWYLDRKDRAVMWDLQVFNTWDQTENFLRGLHNFTGVIDANPEKTKAGELAAKFPGKLWLAFYQQGYNGAETAQWAKPKRGEVPIVKMDKTMAMDNYIARVQRGPNNNGGLALPPNAREIGEHMPKLNWNGFYQQHLEVVRVEEEDTQGRLVAKWKKNRNPDHWHHSAMFAEVATLKKPKFSIAPGIASALNSSGGIV